MSPGAYDHTVRVYDARQEKCVMTMDHGQPVESVLLYPSDGLLVSTGVCVCFYPTAQMDCLCNCVFVYFSHSTFYMGHLCPLVCACVCVRTRVYLCPMSCKLAVCVH